MGKSFLLFFITVFLFFSCTSKKEEPSVSNDNNIHETEVSNVESNEYQIIPFPYPVEIHGIWGNCSYLDDLKQYGSIGKSVERMRFDTDIKISHSEALVTRPQSPDPSFFDTIKYEILKAGIDSLYVRSKNTGQKQLFIKMMNLPDTILTNLYTDDGKYSAIAMLEWKWFHGNYNLTHPDGKTKTVSFNIDGTMKGIEPYSKYIFSIDVDGKDFVTLMEDEDTSDFLLIEKETNNSFICYNIKDFEDWEYPLEKASLAFKLEKID